MRALYVAAALVTIGVGLAVHLGGTFLPPSVRDVMGDALWAMMIAWWVAALGPQLPPVTRSLAAVAICFAVELSQLVHTPGLDAVRRSAPGHWVLGSGFDPRDLAAYALGVAVAAVVDRAARGHLERRAPG
ncbi:MAG: DUF2809 domain-containing protein [Polyangiaceae bacterium]|nr:DUF2809 domain-containing protein [Polyangiaceae bacterium]